MVPLFCAFAQNILEVNALLISNGFQENLFSNGFTEFNIKSDIKTNSSVF